MATVREVLEIVDPITGRGTGRFKSTQSSDFGVPRFLFCDHEHKTREEAAPCDPTLSDS